MFASLSPQTRRVSFALGCYLATAILVLLSAIYGIYNLAETVPSDMGSALQEIANRWDSEWYLDIAVDGYKYERNETGQSVAFFPLFPALVSAVAGSTGLSIEWSGLIASQGCLLSAFILLAQYLASRFPESPNIQKWTLLAFAVFPAGFFWRFLYSESVFLLLAIAVLYSIQRRCSLLWCAVLVGLTTATRPVGVALIPAFIYYALTKTSASHRPPAAPITAAAPITWSFGRLLPYLPVCCLGLFAYMAFLFLQFGEPLAFATTQHYWRVRPVDNVFEMLASFAAWEPIWAVYVPNSYWYWGRVEQQTIPVLSLAFWNPIIFLSFASLVFVGWRRIGR